MVPAALQAPWARAKLSVLALSSRFDGQSLPAQVLSGWWLSVLALSSRFDGHHQWLHSPLNLALSVLALSSRFDGQRMPMR